MFGENYLIWKSRLRWAGEECQGGRGLDRGEATQAGGGPLTGMPRPPVAPLADR